MFSIENAFYMRGIFKSKDITFLDFKYNEALNQLKNLVKNDDNYIIKHSVRKCRNPNDYHEAIYDVYKEFCDVEAKHKKAENDKYSQFISQF